MKIKIHPTTLAGFKQIVEMFESKESTENKDGIISIGGKKAEKYISPIAIEILLQLKKDTILKAKLS
tara:strand:+ start:859 stop:1059 length:201 start_codon:yes stop_codon:yes gene_type:complete